MCVCVRACVRACVCLCACVRERVCVWGGPDNPLCTAACPFSLRLPGPRSPFSLGMISFVSTKIISSVSAKMISSVSTKMSSSVSAKMISSVSTKMSSQFCLYKDEQSVLSLQR